MLAGGARAQSVFERIMLFGAGYLSGHAVHEAGHVIASRLTGIPMQFVFTPNDWPPFEEEIPFTPYMNRGRVMMVNEAGFGAEMAASEFILDNTPTLNTNSGYDCYLLGVLAETIVNPLAYTLIDRLTPGGWGDLRCIRQMGGEQAREDVEAIIVAHAALTLARVAWKLGDGRTFQISSTPTSVDLCVNF